MKEKEEDYKNRTLGLRVTLLDHELISKTIKEQGLSGQEVGCLIASLLLNHFNRRDEVQESRFIRMEIVRNFERLQSYVIGYLGVADERIKVGDEAERNSKEIVKTRDERIEALKKEIESLTLRVEDRDAVEKAKLEIVGHERAMALRVEEIGTILEESKKEKSKLEDEIVCLQLKIAALTSDLQARRVSNEKLQGRLKRLKCQNINGREMPNAVQDSTRSV